MNIPSTDQMPEWICVMMTDRLQIVSPDFAHTKYLRADLASRPAEVSVSRLTDDIYHHNSCFETSHSDVEVIVRAILDIYPNGIRIIP